MMSTKNKTPRSVAIFSSVVRFGIIFLLAAAVAAQSRVVPPAQKNPNPTKKPQVATVRSSDSKEGSRVAINSDQSLNNYEAYRRGDRFYVKIPAADVPRAEAVRGRGFADVKAQRQGDSTVLSFRLQPGATAHVEQRANKLDVVVTVPGGGTPDLISNRGGSGPGSTAAPRASESNRRGTLMGGNRPGPSSRDGSNRPGSETNRPGTGSNSNSASRFNPSSNQGNSNTAKAPGLTPLQSKATPTPQPTPSAKPSATPKPGASPSATPKTGLTSSSSPSSTPAAAGPTAQNSFWSRTKERAHYWILLAQLNPIPVAIGAALLVLIIGLLLFQRRRAKATRRVNKPRRRSRAPRAGTAPVEANAAALEGNAPAAPASDLAAATPAVANAQAAAPAAAVVPVPLPLPSAAPAPAPADGDRKGRVGRVADEAKKVFAGEQYDESVIGSDNPETRRLVGAELASALVGRNTEKRDRARAAFMKHGYFDDATRDLRVAPSENERAAAARRLSFVNDSEATPHLIGALSDPAPDVRRASVEALMDLRDPQAIAPLNSLLQNETDRRVPRNLIQDAIDACATSPGPGVATPAPSREVGIQQPELPAPMPETEREVIEI